MSARILENRRWPRSRVVVKETGGGARCMRLARGTIQRLSSPRDRWLAATHIAKLLTEKHRLRASPQPVQQALDPAREFVDRHSPQSGRTVYRINAGRSGRPRLCRAKRGEKAPHLFAKYRDQEESTKPANSEAISFVAERTGAGAPPPFTGKPISSHSDDDDSQL